MGKPASPSRPKTKLQAVAASDADEKKKGALANALGAIASALGVSAKMKRTTETTKHVTTEEEEGGSESESEEEESEEEEEEGTGSTVSTDGGTSSTNTSEEEEEEEEESAKHKTEEEEEKALAKAVGRATNSPAVHKAFLAALPKEHRDAGALFSPHRMASAAKKATGARTTFSAMHSLVGLKAKSRASDEGLLRKQAKLETRVAKVEGENRKARVDAIVSVAKENLVAGATSKDGRASLRAYGMQHGTKALSEFVGSMPRVARKSARMPSSDGAGNPVGGPDVDSQRAAIEKALVAGITDPKERAELLAEFKAKMAAMNGAAGQET